MQTAFAAFVIALVTSLICTPYAGKLAVRFGIMDKPNPRKVHKEPTPYLGGLAIYAAFVAAILIFHPLDRQMIGMLIGGTFLMIMGALDDKFDLPAKVKLVGQIAAAGVAVASGLRIEWFSNPFGGYIFLGVFSIPLTMLWIVAVTNVLNFVDGLDGLAAGVSTISSVTLLIVAWRSGQSESILITAALAGAALGFLRYNFNPARIFMGDCGALFLGYILATVAIDGLMKSATTIAIAVPVLALGLPILDTAFVMFRRFLDGKSLMAADRGHLHHILYDSGMSQRQTVLWLYAISACLGLSAVELTTAQGRVSGIILGLIGLGLFFTARRGGISPDKSAHHVDM